MRVDYEKHDMEILIFEETSAFCDLGTSGDHGQVQSIRDVDS